MCQHCKRTLIAFKGQYLHAEKPCAGINDSIYIEATIEDEFLHKKFIEMYGKPEMDDSERVTLLEEESDRLYETLKAVEKKFDKPLIKLIMWFYKK